MSKKQKQNVQEAWDNYKRYNIHALRIPGGEKKKREKKFKAIKTENFPNECQKKNCIFRSENTKQNKCAKNYVQTYQTAENQTQIKHIAIFSSR